MSDHALKPWHCTVFSNIFTLITKLYDAQKCAPAFADFTTALFKPSPEWLKVHSNAEFSQCSAELESKTLQAFCCSTKHRRFSPSKATSRENQPNNKVHPFKTMLKACGDTTSSSHFSLLCPPMPSTFSNSVLFTSDFTMNPQSTRAGNPTQNTYSGRGGTDDVLSLEPEAQGWT